MESGRARGWWCIIFHLNDRYPGKQGKGKGKGRRKKNGWELGSSTRSCGAIILFYGMSGLASTETTFAEEKGWRGEERIEENCSRWMKHVEGQKNAEAEDTTAPAVLTDKCECTDRNFRIPQHILLWCL